MELEIGAILEGKVTGITKFGAFVSLPGGSSGLVHISEIANAYVNDVHDYLTDGQTVQVKVLSINEAGKINLSIKQALPPPPRPAFQQRRRGRVRHREHRPHPRAFPRNRLECMAPRGTPALRISSSTSCRNPTAA